MEPLAVLHARFRDVSFGEVLNCLAHIPENLSRSVEWDRMRGTLIDLDPYPLPRQYEYWTCEGPHYKAIGRRQCVCIHLVELLGGSLAIADDDHDADCEEDEGEIEDEFDCHKDRNGLCDKVGSEECEFECPYREES